MKKLALFLALALCLGVVAPFAVSADETIKTEYEELAEAPTRTIGVDCYQALENTGAEVLEAQGKKIYKWGWTSHVGRDNTSLGCGFVDISSDAHSGENAVHINVKPGEYVNLGPQGTVIAGETYELTVWYKRLQDGGNARLELRFSGSNKGVAQTYAIPKMTFDSKVEDGWVQKTMRFVAPEYVTSVWVDLCFAGPGEILWDDVELLCITNEMPKPEMPDKLPAIQMLEFEDPSFENAEVGQDICKIPGWDAEQLFGHTKVSDKYAHTGTKSGEFTTSDGSQDAIAVRYLNNLVEGATYQISSWLMNPTPLSCDMGYWLYYCSEPEYTYDANKQVGQDKPRWQITTSLQWQEYVAEFTVPDGVKSIQLMFRHRMSPGSVYMDDVEIYMVKAPAAIKTNIDATFYYTDWKTGKVSCQPYVLDDPAGSRAEFVLTGLNGEVLDQKAFYGLTAPFEYNFDTALLAEKGERYTVTMTVYDANNAVVEEQSWPVYRYDRPTYLGADGIFRKNGKEIFFSMGSGLNMNVIDKHPEKGGITVAQLNADNPNLGLDYEERMDAYYKQGMFVVLNLYSGVKSAGHPDQIDRTKMMVERLKDHPALFGWKLCDEPYQKGISEEEMIAGYKAIRDIDPNHPVYIDDSPAGSYDWLFRYCDIFECDYYAGSPYNMYEIMSQVAEASQGRKPYSVLLQFFQFNQYMPSFDELRHMIYQSFFAGAKGYSYHTLGVDGSDGVTTKGVDLPEWQEIIDKWVPWELEFAKGCFIKGTYTYVNRQITEEAIWGTFTDGADIYAIVLNRSKDAKTTVSIPLTDVDGKELVGAFTATTMNGKTKNSRGTGTLKVDLEPWEAAVWKVTPSDGALDVSHLKNSAYSDVVEYPWAYTAITTLEDKGIVNGVANNWYGPGENITRGDFAMFLVRSLGITADATENFADVKADADYAKELAIGKAAGILNGVGDNCFNPEAKITRQDMMTMTSRAMKLAGTADLGSFSDSGNIADYAKNHVSAMVAEGLVKGNADGTINPLGNTTRAEAAMICYRIINK